MDGFPCRPWPFPCITLLVRDIVLHMFRDWKGPVVCTLFVLLSPCIFFFYWAGVNVLLGRLEYGPFSISLFERVSDYGWWFITPITASWAGGLIMSFWWFLGHPSVHITKNNKWPAVNHTDFAITLKDVVFGFWCLPHCPNLQSWKFLYYYLQRLMCSSTPMALSQECRVLWRIIAKRKLGEGHTFAFKSKWCLLAEPEPKWELPFKPFKRSGRGGRA